MNFSDCLQAAVSAGELDPERARMATDEWEKLARRYQSQGRSPGEARQAAANDLIDRLRAADIRQRHIAARQLEVLQRNQARYAKAEPGKLLDDIEQVEREGRAIAKMAFGGMRDFLRDHAENIFGQVRGRAQLRDIVRELHGEDSGNTAAKQLAGSVEAQREWLRTSFNSLGGDIRRLDDFGLTHSHNRGKIVNAGFDTWFDDIWQKLDWSRIENFQTGKPFSLKKGVAPFREDAIEFLRPIYDDIATRGWVDRTPGFSVGAKALFNSGAEQRILHFKSADDWMAYNDAFGVENPFQSITGEFERRAMDIARMRSFGPNPKAGIENAIQVMEKAAHLAARNPKPGGVISRAIGRGLQPEERVAKAAAKARVMHGMLSGELNVPADAAMGALMAGTRQLLTAAQLGSATLSMVTDVPSMMLAAKAVGMSPFNPLMNTFRNIFAGVDRQTAKELGFIMDSWANASSTQARYLGDVWQSEITGRISNFVLRANAMTAITDRERIAVAMAFGSDLAKMTDKTWDELDPNLRVFLENRDLHASDWDHLRDPATIFTDRVGGKHINPNWFMAHSKLPEAEARDLAVRLGAVFEAQLELAIPTSSLRGRATVLGKSQGGTVGGELLRSVVMYKSFALSQLFNQIRRVRELQGGWGAKAMYVGSYMTGMTIAGALAVQLKEIAKGRDPQPMDTQKFWMAATMQGGGLGIFGDFFKSSTSRTGGGLAEAAAGPVVGLIGDAGRAFLPNPDALADGKDLNYASGVVNMARRYNPAATLWPTRVALNRLVWDQLQTLMDPDAERDRQRAERKQKRENGNASWWRRGNALPDRAPDLSNALGGSQ